MAGKSESSKKTVAKDKIYVGALVAREVQDKLIELGKPRDLSISDVVREAVREYIAKHATD